jgi:hypothetical protein
MDDKSYIDLIELLQQKIKQEEENYSDSLKTGKQFWQLKEIRKKIHQLKSALEKLQQMSQAKVT